MDIFSLQEAWPGLIRVPTKPLKPTGQVTGVRYLVYTQDGCGELLAQAVQCGGDTEHLFGPLQPISSLEFAPEQSRHRVDHQEADQTAGQEEGDAAGQTHLEGVLQANKTPVSL